LLDAGGWGGSHRLGSTAEPVGGGPRGWARGQGSGCGSPELSHPLLALVFSPLPVHVLGVPGCAEFEHVPVEDVVVGEALPVEEVTEELTQVRVVRLVIEPQGAAEVEVCGELGWRGSQKRLP